MGKHTLQIEPAAEREFYNVVKYYKRFDEGLSKNFVYEFDQAVETLLKYPKAGHPYLHNTKRIFLKRFRFADKG